jgi:hypothetical protein
MNSNNAISKDWKVTCQVCRENIKASQAVRRWDGLVVGANHSGCFEHRHPNDFPMPPIRDQSPLPFTSPEGTDVETTFCSVDEQSSVAGIGTVGCIIAGFAPEFVPSTVPSGSFSESTL